MDIYYEALRILKMQDLGLPFWGSLVFFLALAIIQKTGIHSLLGSSATDVYNSTVQDSFQDNGFAEYFAEEYKSGKSSTSYEEAKEHTY